MPGPTTAADALAWAQDAMKGGRYIPDVHFEKRCWERGLNITHARRAIASATVATCQPYPDHPCLADGTGWRIGGVAFGEEVSIGVELFQDHLGRRALLITIF